MGARDRIRDFFLKNVGNIVSTDAISKVARIHDYQRRIRELRNEEGLQILSHKDRHDLKPGQYVLETKKQLPVIGRGISHQLRTEIMERNGFTCQICGSTANDPDTFNPSRKLRLHIDHVRPVSQGGTNDRENLRVLCSACNEGKSNLQPASESTKNLLARIRKADRQTQRAIFEALKKTYDQK
jgi:hypothetical protein